MPKVVFFRERKTGLFVPSLNAPSRQAYRAAGEGYDGPLAPLPVEQPVKVERKSTEVAFEAAASQVWEQLQIQMERFEDEQRVLRDRLLMQQERHFELENELDRRTRQLEQVEYTQHRDKRLWMIAAAVALPLLALLNVLLWRHFI